MKFIFTPLFACLFVLPAFAQQRGDKTFFKFNPSTLSNEVDIYLEHEFGHNMSIEAGTGFIFTDYWDYLLNQVDFGQINPNISRFQYSKARGFNARLGLRYYIVSSYSRKSRAKGTYFEPLLLFKKVIYPNNQTTIQSQQYWNHASKYVMGAQLLVGRQTRKGNFIFDRYVGLGVKAKTYYFDHYYYNNTWGTAKNGKIRTTNWLPSIQLGIKIGFQIR
ncbi:MAG TPA: hypothetical protein VNE41_02030 [Chitinophagaceae bacterium]|nr:hypothetical protein [Chitinophagaceae bacterium]